MAPRSLSMVNPCPVFGLVADRSSCIVLALAGKVPAHWAKHPRYGVDCKSSIASQVSRRESEGFAVRSEVSRHYSAAWNPEG